jgi:hypothetical protein
MFENMGHPANPDADVASLDGWRRAFVLPTAKPNGE